MAAACDDALLEGVDIREQIVRTLCCADDVDAALVVVAYLMAGSPDAARLRHLLVVHNGGDGRFVVPRAVSGGVHIGAGTAEDIPHVAVATLEVLNAHIALLVLHNAVPDAHQALHLIGFGLLHQVGTHAEHQVLRLQVQHRTGLEQLFLQELPVGIGHIACSIPVALQPSAFDMYGDVGICIEHRPRIGHLIEDVKHLLFRVAQQVQTGLQCSCLASGMVAWHTVGAHGLHHQRGTRLGP